MQTVKKQDQFKAIGGKNKNKSDLNCLRRLTPPSAYPKNLQIKFVGGEIVSEETLRKHNIKTLALNYDHNTSATSKSYNVQSKTRRRIKLNKSHYSVPDNTKSDNIDDSSDENSSKSTLDLIIPPPSNFHGRNNPFHSQYKTIKSSEKASKKGLKAAFEKLPEIRIVRTIKRRLSAKDITFCGSNRMAKRRKIMKRRKSSEVEIISEIMQPVSSAGTFPFIGGDAKSLMYLPSKDHKGLFDRNKEGKRLQRNYKDKNVEDECKTVEISLAEAVINSPVKNKSINLYFGAFNRIENGEIFSILAKRLTFDGKEQYLLEWDASNPNPNIRCDKK